MLVQTNLVTLYSENFTPSHHSTSYLISGRKKLLNEIVILKRKIAAKGKRSETKRKANKDMKRENESVYLSAEENKYIEEDNGSPSHHPTGFSH